MSEEMWIKIGLAGADPQMGTVHGRVELESFPMNVRLDDRDEEEEDVGVMLDTAIHLSAPFKLFDPIVLQLGVNRNTGEMLIVGALALTKTAPTVTTDYITFNPANISWWAPLVIDEQWEQIMAKALSNIDLAGGGDIDIQLPSDLGL